MAERNRDDAVDRGREATSLNQHDDQEQHDDLSRRRAQEGQRPSLTRRERDERWPIG